MNVWMALKTGIYFLKVLEALQPASSGSRGWQVLFPQRPLSLGADGPLLCGSSHGLPLLGVLMALSSLSPHMVFVRSVSSSYKDTNCIRLGLTIVTVLVLILNYLL